MKDSVQELSELLQNSGYEVAIGCDNTRKMIAEKADHSTTELCSGYGVFPDGRKCVGCADCNQAA